MNLSGQAKSETNSKLKYQKLKTGTMKRDAGVFALHPGP
jgi:hypothetical protein